MVLDATYDRTWDFDGDTSCRIYFDWKRRLVGGGLTESSFSNHIDVNCPGFQAQYCGPGAEVGL